MAFASSLPVSRRCHARPAAYRSNQGPVVAIAASPGDPSIHAAAAIAIAAKEELVIIEADGHDADDPRTRELATDTGLIIKLVAAAKIALPDPATRAQTFRQTQEWLVVITRGTFEDGAAPMIAAARRVPVLVVEPLGMAAGETIPRPNTAH